MKRGSKQQGDEQREGDEEGKGEDTYPCVREACGLNTWMSDKHGTDMAQTCS